MRDRIAKSQREVMHHKILSISSSVFLFLTEPEEHVETVWILKSSRYRAPLLYGISISFSAGIHPTFCFGAPF